MQAQLCAEIVDAGQLADLRWPDFSDYQVYLRNFYEPSCYSIAWIHAGVPTPQARNVIEAPQQADNKGLLAKDYDGRRWSDLVAHLGQIPSTAPRGLF